MHLFPASVCLPYLSIYLSRSLSFYLSHSLPFFLSLPLIFSFFLSLNESLSLCLYRCPCLSVSIINTHTLSGCLSLSHLSLSLSGLPLSYLSLLLTLFPSLSPSLSLQRHNKRLLPSGCSTPAHLNDGLTHGTVEDS